jgi:glycogen debranching enzyme
MKKRFNDLFLFENEGYIFPVQALDGNKNQIRTVTGNPLLLLWAAYQKDGEIESILEKEFVRDLVNRSFMEDMFDHHAGIRTMSSKSRTYRNGQDSYHNGSFWPKLNGMSHEGLENFGFQEEAAELKDATLKPLFHFGSPVELYVTSSTGEYLPFFGNGQRGCETQAWSAAVALDLLSLETHQ